MMQSSKTDVACPTWALCSAILTKPCAGSYLMLSPYLSATRQHSKFFSLFLIAASFFPQELKLIAVWHDSEAAQMSVRCPKGRGWVLHCFSSAALSAGSSPTRDNPAEKSLLFWSRTKLVLVGTSWTSFLWGLMRTYQSGAACTRGAGREQGWREDAKEVVSATW